MELINISKSYNGERVLENVSLSVGRGDTLMLYAASGSGKTTLLRIIMGLEKPDSGELHGVPKRISAVFQEDRLPEEFTAVKCVKMTCGADKAEILRHLAEVGLSGLGSKRVKELSGGMKRRVAIVRALMHSSDMLILDEPFNGMDAETKALVIEYIKRHRSGRTLIFVSHSSEDAALLNARTEYLRADSL